MGQSRPDTKKDFTFLLPKDSLRRSTEEMGSLSESLVSFFKVMIDDDFSRVLKLPPKFARTATHLLNKKIYLENLNKQSWHVVVSKEKGSLAFRKGWQEFSTAHNLKIGDLVVFHYFASNYFIVQVFNRTACDVRSVSMGNVGPSKRRRYEMNPVDIYGSARARCGPSAVKQNSPGEEYSNDSIISASDKEHVHIHDSKNAIDASLVTIVPATKNTKRKAEQTNSEDPEVQFIMIGRDISNEQREDRNVIDLSEYELPSADVECNRKPLGTGWSLPYAETAVKCEEEPRLTEFATIKQEISQHGEFPESAVGKEVVEFTSLKQEMKGHIEFPEPAKGKDVTEFTRLNQEMKCHAEFPGSAVEEKVTKFANVKQEVKCHVEFPESAQGNKVQTRFNSDVKHIIYGATTVGSLDSTDLSFKNGAHFPNLSILKTAAKPVAPFQSGKALVKVKKEIQTEPFEETGLALVTASASDLQCRVRSASSMFLELPGSLPLFTSTPSASESKLVILRDAAERVWPVFYHDKPCMKLLTTGWPAFQKANNIQPGDTCIFKADPGANLTYEVSIVRKENKPT